MCAIELDAYRTVTLHKARLFLFASLLRASPGRSHVALVEAARLYSSRPGRRPFTRHAIPLLKEYPCVPSLAGGRPTIEILWQRVPGERRSILDDPGKQTHEKERSALRRLPWRSRDVLERAQRS